MQFRALRRVVTLSVLTAALTVVPASGAFAAGTADGPGAHAAGKCSGTFQVLHNDHIGTVSFPAGPYTMVTSLLSCSEASALFARFLQDYDGVLPQPWILLGPIRRFVEQGTKVDFQVTPVKAPPVTTLQCPGTFQVLHNDRIGTMSVPAGAYTITRLSKSSLSCASASRQFAYFLDYDWRGTLPKPWRSNVAAKRFFTSSTNGFVVKRTGGGGGGGGRTHAQCPGTFRVLSNDRIGALRLAAGPYTITAWGGLSCSSASALFRQFLSDTSGNLPASWVLEPETATFLRGQEAFRVKPA